MNNIPVLHVCEKTLAEAYENALLTLYNEGTRFETQYDKPGKTGKEGTWGSRWTRLKM